MTLLMTTLLLIEDDPECARMVGKLLKPPGFTIEHTPRGLTGLQLARKLEVDLILVDIDLPDISGNVVILQLRSVMLHRRVPIIAFTAETSSKAKRIAAALGADGFICKPIDTQTFSSQIGEFLKLSVPH